MTGPKIDIDAVHAAIGAVDDGYAQMEAVTQQILASSGLSLLAMKAPAGQIAASAFGQLGGGGKALAEQLAVLRDDLGTLVQVALEGSDDAASVAKSALAISTTAAMA